MTEPASSPPPAPQRIGDAERDHAAELLRDHLAEGRLSAEEFDERIDTALRAKTQTDLDRLFTDLPGPKPGQAVATTTAYEPPPWQQGRPNPPSTPAPVAAQPSDGMGRTTAAGIVGALWVVVPLAITFTPGLGWANFWWLIFLPMVVSMIIGRNESHRDRERRRIARDQERLDRRRREIGD